MQATGKKAALALGVTAFAAILVIALLGDRWPALAGETVPTQVPDFQPPPPTGAWAVGRRHVVFSDPSRASLPAARRDLQAWIHYPITPGSPSRATILPAEWLTAYQPLLAKRVGDAAASALLQARWPVTDAAPIAAGDDRFPVIVFAHGYGQMPSNYQALITGLVSEGHVVVAIASAGVADLVLLPDGRQALKDDISDALYQASADDIVFAARQMQRLDTTPAHPLAGRLDTRRIAAVGHSLGGAGAVLALTAPQSPLVLAVNLDGDYGGASAEVAPTQPILYLTTTPPELIGSPPAQWREESNENRRDTLWQRLSAASRAACRVRMEDTLHSNFLDAALLPPASMPESKRRNRYGPIDGARALLAISTVMQGFLDNHLAPAAVGTSASRRAAALPGVHLEAGCLR